MIIFKDDIKKANTVDNERLQQLLNKKEPKITKFLARMWKGQQNAITYQELRSMVMSGEIDGATMERWYADYADFIKNYLIPEWRDMMISAAEQIEDKKPLFVFNPAADEVNNYISAHTAELVTAVTGQQIEAVRSIVDYANKAEITVDELSKIVRPTIGLYKGQAVANTKYYNFVKNSLLENNPKMKEATAAKRAKEAAVKYAERQHRYRAMLISRSELAWAYNTGEHNAVKQAINQGLMGESVKRWLTADDGDRVCKYCKALDNVTVGIDEYFPGTDKLIPPLHPQCRCVVNYEEIETEGETDIQHS